VKSQIRAAWKRTAGAFLLVILPPVAGQTPTASSPSRQSIELMVGHGRVLHLDEAAESVYVGDTTIADLRIVAPDVIYVYGRKIGSTNLIAISANQKVLASLAFRVVADPGSVNKMLSELQPTTHTSLKLFGNRVAAVGPSVSLRRRPPWSARLRSRLSSKPMPGPNSGLVFK
jgi:pilus assembly protein CpaC